MSREEKIWHDFNLEDNCVEVSDLNQVRLYFAQFSLALDALDRVFRQTLGGSNTEAQAVDACISRLRETFRVLGLKHFYTGIGDELKIDATDSGFFHFGTLTGLRADAKLRKSDLESLPEAQALKEMMWDRIATYRTHPRELQVQLARRLYLEELVASRLTHEFQPGVLHEVATLENEVRSYFWSFSTYDKALNRPFIYLIYFTYEKPGHALGTSDLDYVQLTEAAQRHACGRTNLLAFSRTLDEAMPHISPKVVRRIILGPYHSPAFTRVTGPLGEILEAQSARFPFVLNWETETLLSDRAQTIDSGWLKKGRLRQIFWVPKNLELSARGVSSLEKFVLCPHWLGQHLSQARLFDDHQRFVIDAEERVHGIH